MSNIEQLEARVGELEARLAIMDLEARYAAAWDAGDGDGWAALFTEDGVFEMAGVGDRETQTTAGRQALVAFCQQVDSFYKGLHFMHLPAITVENDRASARLHFQWRGSFNRGNQFFGSRSCDGYYDVSYTRSGGEWKIARRYEKAVSGVTGEDYDVYR